MLTKIAADAHCRLRELHLKDPEAELISKLIRIRPRRRGQEDEERGREGERELRRQVMYLVLVPTR